MRKGLCACVKTWITCWSWSVLLATDSNSTVLHFDSLNKPDLSWPYGPVITGLAKITYTLHNWCKRWWVLINTEKSKVVHFRTGRHRRSDFQFKVGDNVLETTDWYKYLDVIFTEKMNFNNNADNLAQFSRSITWIKCLLPLTRMLMIEYENVHAKRALVQRDCFL